MNSRRFTVACALIGVGVAAAISYALSAQVPVPDQALPPFSFQREGAASPEDAAKSLFHACATESPKHFVQHLLLGVCDGPIDTLQKFAECLHSTKFHHGEDSFTVYDLSFGKQINPKKSFRAIATQDFDRENKQVAALQFQMMSTYYGEQFKCVDVVAESYDSLEYGTRIVVAQVGEGWYAIPRCRSSKAFYEVADAMQLTALSSDTAK